MNIFKTGRARITSRLRAHHTARHSHSIGFVDGACKNDTLLRHHILAPIKSALLPQTSVINLTRDARRAPGTLRVSMFPSVAGDVLMMFDLADRNHFRQSASDGHYYVQDFRKILVPGEWLRSKLLSDPKLGLTTADVVAVGAPRVDYLRDLMAKIPAKTDDAPLTVLFAPLHESWKDDTGQSISINAAMAPYLDTLKANFDLRVHIDERSKGYKVPITQDLLAADIVIADHASVIYEAWALGKPVIFPRWLGTQRILKKASGSAEAHIHREEIGHHADSFEALLALLAKGRALDLGAGVDTFMANYLANWSGEPAGPVVARLLEHLTDPLTASQDREAGLAVHAAIVAKDWVTAQTHLSAQLRDNPNAADLYDTLAKVLNRQGKWWQELAALETMKDLGPPTADMFNRLAISRQRMGRTQAAAQAYGHALAVAPQKATAEWYYNIGYAFETQGTDGPPDLHKSAHAYDLACAHDPSSDAARFGHGALHAAAGRWSEAQGAYRARISTQPLDAKLYYRLGMSHDRCYEWQAAENAYVQAIALDMSQLGWHFRLGFVLERQEKFTQAASAYLHAAQQSKTHNETWYYRAGYALEKAGNLTEACRAYALVIPEADTAVNADDTYTARFFATRLRLIKAELAHDCTRPENWLRYSESLEGSGNLDGAITAMKQAVLRLNDHRPSWHNRLGQLLVCKGDLAAACAAFRDQQILQRPHGIYEQKFKTSETLREKATYREFHDLLPIMGKSVMYESYGGVAISCSPMAIFRSLLDDPRFADWTHIWSVEDVSLVPHDLLARPNVIFIARGSVAYLRYLATAQYLVHNSTYPFYFVRRDGQHYLNTWHGTPLKTLGYDIKDNPLQLANTARNLLQTTLIVSPNEHTESVMLDRYGIRNLYRGTSIITGYPRIDMMLNATSDDTQRIKEQLGIDPTKPVILYAPTYRGLWSTPEIEAEALIEDLKKLESDDYNLVFRGHYFAEKLILQMNLPITVAKHEIDTCTLLAAVDVLITDFSSIFFDFLPTSRPIIHYVPDWDDYAAQRGLYFDKSDLPGRVCGTIDDLHDAVKQATNDTQACIGPAYRQAQARFSTMEDGKSTSRVIEAFFFGKRQNVGKVMPTGSDKAVLIHCGTLDKNGITASASALLGALKVAGFACHVLVNRRTMVEDDLRIQRAVQLLDRADVVVRSGATCFSLEEHWINDKLNSHNTLSSSEMEKLHAHSMVHEARRLFGAAQPCLSIDFYGYRQFTANLIASVAAAHSAIYLHNDMQAERVMKFPYLEGAFQSYKGFDALISVSDSINEVNARQLSEPYDVAPQRFHAVPNMLDLRAIKQNAKSSDDDPDLALFLQDTRQKIVSVARLSPEKNQFRLIDAVALMRETGMDVALYLVGAGPSRTQLEHHCKQKLLVDAVTFLGIKENPYPYIQNADCLGLSSDHEGQGIVLLEAMTLGVPCVSTDIPGPRSVLANDLGLLTDTTAQALADGITRVLNGDFQPNSFDATAYNATALADFFKAVGLKDTARKPA